MAQSCAPREPPCWQATISVSSGALFQFGADHAVQLPPGDVCDALISCCFWSSIQICTQPLFCCAAVTATAGGAARKLPGSQGLQLPPGVSWKQLMSTFSSVMPHNCAPRAPPCCEAAMLSSRGAPFQFGPAQPLQFPPGEVCHMVQSCWALSVTQSSTRPSFCCAAATSSTPAWIGPEPIGDHPAHVPPGVS